MHRFNVKTSCRSEMLDITSRVQELVPPELKNGLCHVFCLHTTAGLTVNENADPAVRADILHHLDRQVPWDDPAFTHGEGNSSAHIKASMMGLSLTVPVERGRLKLGTWQGIYFCEFDGPRMRSVEVSFVKAE